MTIKPWVAAVEMQLMVAKLAARLWDDSGHNQSDWMYGHVARMMSKATPFSWDSEVASAVLAASESIPDHLFIPDDTPEGVWASWFWFDRPLGIWPCSGKAEVANAVEKDKVSGLLAWREHGHLYLQAFRPVVDGSERLGGPVPGPIATIRNGTTFGDYRREVRAGVHTVDAVSGHYRKDGTALKVIEFYAAAVAWINQRFISSEMQVIQRHARKRIKRDFGVDTEGVRVVQLRRAEASHNDNAGDASATDWSCRWIVNGHWRNQPYKDGHRLKYILPYVKGPADKPLKVPSQTVYEVSR